MSTSTVGDCDDVEASKDRTMVLIERYSAQYTMAIPADTACVKAYSVASITFGVIDNKTIALIFGRIGSWSQVATIDKTIEA